MDKPAEKKLAGVADAIANMSVGDDELRRAADRLRKNREKTQEAQQKPSAPATPKKPQPANDNVTQKSTPTAKPKQPKQPAVTKSPIPKQWSNATATLNTRIPPEMDQMLDNLLAKQRRIWKENNQPGTKPTKQKIVQAVLADFFKNSKQ